MKTDKDIFIRHSRLGDEFSSKELHRRECGLIKSRQQN
uniref:Uncharacterized protein n=1 Tax=Arundo donax TaxID=35708 RepID=A0A0A9GEG1_ARUDO